MQLVKIHPDFPVLLIANWCVLDQERRDALIKVVLENKQRNCREEIGFNFLIDRDHDNFFRNLYQQFVRSSFAVYGDIKLLPTNSANVWSYTSSKGDHAPEFFHNHIHSATINGVYYLNIPMSATAESGSISFQLRDKVFSYRPNNFDLILFPSYLDHKINYLDDEEYRISINMEILCEPIATDLPGDSRTS